jgi:N-acetylglucosaminyldiphosphoundecaprenol N-acetyl-beta-D-mannosaminyltransferase
LIAGTKRQAPSWMRDAGLEWLFRLGQEPGRLWKRYLIGNSLFMWYALRELLTPVSKRTSRE